MFYCDGWIDKGNHPLLNIIVSSISGSCILRATVCSGENKNALFLRD